VYAYAITYAGVASGSSSAHWKKRAIGKRQTVVSHAHPRRR
jgi:hypothetical protein